MAENINYGGGQLSVPPGFRFHPTDEELVYYYLRKKVSYEPIDLDVIREVDLNKLEPWDLKETCRIGSGGQNDWYFFSHKDKKYPTGTRTNRATSAGFWKATGRDKAIHMTCNSKRIGMRKTLVFYTGRAPRGHKTDWIMHEYRLDDDNSTPEIQVDGWVVCRVFKKKNITRDFNPQIGQDVEHITIPNFHASVGCTSEQTHVSNQAQYNNNNSYTFDHNGSMHLPQLFSPESTDPTSFLSSLPMNKCMDMQSQHLLSLSSGGSGPSSAPEKLSGDWSFLDKLLATHHNVDHISSRSHHQFTQVPAPQGQRFPLSNYHGLEPDFSRYLK